MLCLLLWYGLLGSIEMQQDSAKYFSVLITSQPNVRVPKSMIPTKKKSLAPLMLEKTPEELSFANKFCFWLFGRRFCTWLPWS